MSFAAKSIVVTFAATAIAVAAAACGSPSPGSGGGRQRLSIATGGTGGVFYPYGGGIAKIISDNIPNVEATAEVTAASVDNLKFLRDQKADLAFTTGDMLADAINGNDAFEGMKLPLRALAVRSEERRVGKEGRSRWAP